MLFHTTRVPVRQKMGLLFIMFMLQNISLGFTWTLMPLLMRQQGLSLGGIGLSALLYSPWALKFLWASCVDRYYSQRWGRRKSWIMPLYLLTICILPVLALLNPEGNLPKVLLGVFLLNLTIATVDIAVDGYATDILRPEERSRGNTIQMVGYLVGYMIGSGVFLMIYHWLGWDRTLLAMALVHMVLIAPVLAHRELPPVNHPPEHETETGRAVKPSARAFLRQSHILWFLLFLVMLCLAGKGGDQLRLALLSDLGLTPHDLGKFLLWVGSPLSILGAIACGFFFDRWGALRIFGLSCLVAAGLGWFTALVSMGIVDARWSVAMMLGMEKILFGIIMVMTFNMIMALSTGGQSATNFAVLISVNDIVFVGAIPILGVLGDSAGYTTVFAGLGCFCIFALFFGRYILIRRMKF